MHKLISYIKKIVERLGTDPPPGPEKNPTSDGMSNRQLLDDLLILFKDVLNKESLGNTMLFPMYFDILMHPDDYNDRKDALAVILPEFVEKFMEVINENRATYPKIKNVSTKWVFQFSPCRVDGELEMGNGKIIKVERGKLIKSARLFYKEDVNGNIHVDSNVKVSVKCDNSDVMNISFLNFEALKSVDIVEDGLYMYNYSDGSPITDKGKQQKNEHIDASNPNSMATLTYTYQGHRIHYTMLDERISISGRKDTRKQRMIFKLENDKLENDHVQIKFDRKANEFYLCAFGKTKLNQRSLDLSVGGDVKWYKLADNSSIFMNDEIKVEFVKK